MVDGDDDSAVSDLEPDTIEVEFEGEAGDDDISLTSWSSSSAESETWAGEIESITSHDVSLELGLEGELAASFEEITSTGADGTLFDTPDLPPSPAYELFDEYDIPTDNQEMIQTVLRKVYRELNNTPGTSVPDEVVLGTPQYAILTAWCLEEHGTSLAVNLPVEEIRVVPGPMIHAGPNRVVVEEYLEREFGDIEDETDE
jgi:hypothetical protein